MDVIVSDDSSGSESGSSDSDDHSAFMEHMNVMSIGGSAKPYQFEPLREDINLDDNSLVSSNEDENEDRESRFENLNW